MMSIFDQYIKKEEHDAHATLSASGSKRWLGCPGSIRLSDGIPSVDTEASIDGTNAHTLLQFILENYSSWERLLTKPEAKHFKHHIGYSEQQLKSVLVAARFVWAELARLRSLTGRQPELFTEQKLELNGVGFGTSDIIIYQLFGLLHVIDYKNGCWPVDPVDNTQGLYYACAAADRFGWDFSRVHITIIQPNLARGKVINTWKTTPERLEEAGECFRKGAALTRKRNAPLIPHHDYCWFCPARPKCPKVMKQREGKIMGRFER
jgi:Protein of unknown function (DUF2800)